MGDAKPLVKMMKGAKMRFVRFVYQSNNDWKRWQCKRLLDAIEQIVRENRPPRFFGSVASESPRARHTSDPCARHPPASALS
ncbi:hypothetical protein [Paratractidigestivibacter sp.]|uniref:hypothetical protein n=1 Tax=Paratractidigestivibacter sp. TaxID=2847316 RepID=UPI002AC9E197|nr:hypothetical protein [Paratractidigestivibacter sp.]